MSKKTLKLYHCLLSTLLITNTAYISYSKDNQWVNEAKTVTLSKSKSNDFFKELPISYLAFIENNQADICSLTMQIWSRCCSIVNSLIFFIAWLYWKRFKPHLIPMKSKTKKKKIEFSFSMTSWNWGVVFKVLSFLRK